MILSFLFYAFVFYLAYKLVFDFIIPVYRTTRKVKRGFRDMQERMRQAGHPYGTQVEREQPPEPNKNKAGDYIEFEEIK